MSLELLGEYLPLFARAARLTLWVGLAGVVLSTVVGLVCAVVRHFRVPFARQLVGFYIEVSRNTPLVVQLFFLYFGLPKIGVVLSSTTCAIVGLTFLGGAYMAEAFRSGLEAVDSAQTRSALALGMTRRAALVYIVLPQGLAQALPAFTANVIFLIKETSVVS
ncbi:MAG: amino acid ABC transporter permease, partial [Bifidobacteriaceae bacterium]|nr:amino acid ABC transporter permease [Bifidobacteriaceae bacterium]